MIWRRVGATAFGGAILASLSLTLFPVAALPSQASFEESLYAMSLNGTGVSDGVMTLIAPDGRLYISLETLRRLRIKIVPKPQALLTIDNLTYYDLSAISGLSYKIDDAKQMVLIDASPSALIAQDIHTNDAGQSSATVAKPIGAFLNYDVAAGNVVPGANVGVTLSGAAPAGSGMFSFAGVATNAHTGGTNAIVETWQKDYVTTARSLRVGSASAVLPVLFANGASLQFYGVQYGSNFATVPYQTFAPVPTIYGNVNGPSLLDVYVNNVLVSSGQQVDGGTFRLQDLPAVNGQGQVRLIVRDALGREQTVTSSYYNVPQALAKGISDFSVQAGFENNNLSLVRSSGSAIAAASERYGLTNATTIEGAFAADAFAKNAGGGAVLVSPRYGSLELGAAYGSGSGMNGFSATGSYAYSSPRWSVGFSALVRSPNFPLVGVSQAFTTRHSFTGSFGAAVGRGSASFSYGLQGGGVNVDGSAISEQRLASLSYQRPIGPMQLIVSANRTFGEIATRYVSMQLLVPLGRSTFAATSSFTNGTASTGVQFSSPRLSRYSGAGYFFDAQKGAVTNINAGGDVALPAGLLNGSFAAGSGRTTYRADYAGGVAFAAGHAFFSQQIQGGFALAQVPGFPGVHVLANGQQIGRTARDGSILIPDLQAYANNTIAVDPLDLPISASGGDFKANAVPAYHGGLIVPFKILSGGFLVHMHSANGEPLPAGATISIDGDTQQWTIGDEGLAYIEGVTPGRIVTLRASGGTAHCSVAIVLPKDLSAIPDLGPVVCR